MLGKAPDRDTAPASGGASLSHVAARGVAWLMVQSMGARAVGLLSQIVLAWLLVPADFGVLALVFTVTNVATVIASAGVDQVLMQRGHKLRYWALSGFWAGLGLATVAMFVVLAGAFAAAHFYRTPVLLPLAAIVGLSMPLGALSMLPSVALRGAMNFRFGATYGLIELVLTQAATIFLAWRGFGAFSFVIPIPILALLRAVVFWVRAPVALHGRLRAAQFRRLAGRGSAVFGSRLLTQAVANADYFVLGFVASHTAVGLYYFAFRLAAQPVRMLAGNFSSVLFPALGKLAGEPARQHAAAYNAARVLSYAAMPFCFLQAAVAEPALPLLFGERWRGAIPLIQLLSLGLPFDAVSWIGGALLSARGEFRRAFIYSCLFSPVFFLVIGFGALLGSATGVAVAVALYYVVFAPVYLFLTLATPGKALSEAFDLFAMPALLAAVSIGGAYAISLSPGLESHPILRVIWIGLAGPACYVALMLRFRRDVFADILARFHLEPLMRFAPFRRLAVGARR